MNSMKEALLKAVAESKKHAKQLEEIKEEEIREYDSKEDDLSEKIDKQLKEELDYWEKAVNFITQHRGKDLIGIEATYFYGTVVYGWPKEWIDDIQKWYAGGFIFLTKSEMANLAQRNVKEFNRHIKLYNPMDCWDTLEQRDKRILKKSRLLNCYSLAKSEGIPLYRAYSPEHV